MWKKKCGVKTTLAASFRSEVLWILFRLRDTVEGWRPPVELNFPGIRSVITALRGSVRGFKIASSLKVGNVYFITWLAGRADSYFRLLPNVGKVEQAKRGGRNSEMVVVVHAAKRRISTLSKGFQLSSCISPGLFLRLQRKYWRH